jgi:hypothetical protein
LCCPVYSRGVIRALGVASAPKSLWGQAP